MFSITIIFNVRRYILRLLHLRLLRSLWREIILVVQYDCTTMMIQPVHWLRTPCCGAQTQRTHAMDLGSVVPLMPWRRFGSLRVIMVCRCRWYTTTCSLWASRSTLRYHGPSLPSISRHSYGYVLYYLLVFLHKTFWFWVVVVYYRRNTLIQPKR